MNNGYQNYNMPNHQLKAEGDAWTDSGRELLRIFKVEIQRSGGRHRVLAKVKRERNRRNYRFKTTEVPVSVNSIIFNNWHKMSSREIGKLVGLSCQSVLARGKFLGLPLKPWVRSTNGDKPVLNIDTGIYYDSIQQAADSMNQHIAVLSRKISGKRKNNTSFIRV